MGSFCLDRVRTSRRGSVRQGDESGDACEALEGCEKRVKSRGSKGACDRDSDAKSFRKRPRVLILECRPKQKPAEDGIIDSSVLDNNCEERHDRRFDSLGQLQFPENDLKQKWFGLREHLADCKSQMKQRQHY